VFGWFGAYKIGIGSRVSQDGEWQLCVNTSSYASRGVRVREGAIVTLSGSHVVFPCIAPLMRLGARNFDIQEEC